ncbi:hypothetical protein BLNAU_11178 [Blattamonas nauphoetae]|uniref:Uncharacterized protein n=1 Tax=Blattamonas nauphoetae TaxID=2049346 RepID=A0ABQ9XNE9_9EUKA|nr:hypothetical protein BLNAU_11178 [Blattamonas nauphoetae]
MTAIDNKPDASSSTARSDMSSSQLPFSMDCSAFLNWREDADETIQEKAIVFQSLVATMMFQPAFDVSLEAKAAQFLESVRPEGRNSADAFLGTLASNSDKSSPDFVQSILVLISSASQAITTASIKMLDSLFDWCSAKFNLTLVNADLIPQLIDTLHPLSLSFTEAVDIHICLMNSINHSLWLATTDGLSKLETEDDDEDQAVYETVLQQVLVPSEMYIWHLCANSFSMIDEDQSMRFLKLLARLLQVSPVYQPIMDFVLDMPVVLAISSCLTFFEDEHSIWDFLNCMTKAQRDWNETEGEERQLWKTVLRMLRMEGFEDVDSLSPVSLDGRHTFRLHFPHSHTSQADTEGSEDIVAQVTAGLDPCSLATHTLPLPTASPSPPTPSHSPLPLPHHPHPPTPLCLSLTTHTLPLPSASPSPPTPSHSLCLSLTTHTLPLPSASPSPPTPSHSPLPLPHHPHPPTPLCLSLTTHTLPLPSAIPLSTLGVVCGGFCSFGAHPQYSHFNGWVLLCRDAEQNPSFGWLRMEGMEDRIELGWLSEERTLVFLTTSPECSQNTIVRTSTARHCSPSLLFLHQ